jgi:hypothetical protein
VRPWTQVSDLGRDGMCSRCRGPLRSSLHRMNPPGTSAYERCAAYHWCSPCRRYTGQTVHVPADRDLPDPLGDLPADERTALRRTWRLVPYVDRVLTRTGRAPTPRWVVTPEPATDAEVDAALAEDPSDDLACFLVGRYEGGAYNDGPYADHWFEKRLR